jgi:hypothetical protein
VTSPLRRGFAGNSSAPELVLRLLQGERIADLPLHAPPRVTAAEFVDLNFAEHRADAVLVLGDPAHPSCVLVVEVQSEVDRRKHWTWPLYVAGLRARYRCPVLLVILAPFAPVAAWCAEPIDLGHGRCVLHPLVVGPDQIPVITDPAEARRAPELAVLSVAAHGHEPGAEFIALAALAALRDLDSEDHLLYPDFVFALLGGVARTALEQLMRIPNYEYQSDFARKYYYQGKEEGQAEGKAEGQAEGEAAGKALGRAELLLKLLRLRGFVVPDELQTRIFACRDIERLDRWAERLLAAGSLADVFADDAP